MASGHVNRTNRPNTWLHRPATRREDSPCQLGAVHTWHIATNVTAAMSESWEKRTLVHRPIDAESVTCFRPANRCFADAQTARELLLVRRSKSLIRSPPPANSRWPTGGPPAYGRLRSR
jgi:hypothetical protein